MHNIQYQRPKRAQTQREVIVNIRDPQTVANLGAMNTRNLKAHVDRAVEQSNNGHIKGTKVLSTNQLKSGDLSIKTATTQDMETLRQFAQDWTHRIGNRTSVQVPTYGVIAHCLGGTRWTRLVGIESRLSRRVLAARYEYA